MRKKTKRPLSERVVGSKVSSPYPYWIQAILLAAIALLLANCSAEDKSDTENRFVDNGQQGSSSSGSESSSQAGRVGSSSTSGSQNDSPSKSGSSANSSTPQERTCGVECPECTIDKTGVGTGRPFDLSNPNSIVTLDSGGALVIEGTTGARYNTYLWVADTDLPGVLKIDLETLQVVARYATPGLSTSRTTVNALGEAFVACRGSSVPVITAPGTTGIAKFYPDGNNCPDTNGDGVITTSTGPDDVLPLGQDDCLAWYTELPGDIRGLAAQDVPGTVYDSSTCEGYNPDTQEFDIEEDIPEDKPDQHFVWGGGVHASMYKLEASTGDVLVSSPIPIGDYGAALSGDGKLYFTGGFYGAGLAFIDTFNCEQNNCPIEVLSNRIPIPSAYGITVDCKQRVWLTNGPTKRWDPAAVGQELTEGPRSGLGGIAADAHGWIWACNADFAASSLVRVNAETMESTTIELPCKGVAVDSDSRVFTIASTPSIHSNAGASTIHIGMVEPGPTIDDYTLTPDAITLSGFAYAYSDMTGVQTRLASNEPGWYRQTFEHGCGDVKTEWRNLEWDVEIPDGSWVMFKARAAESPEELASASWHTVACLSSENSGKGCGYIGQRMGNFLEIETRFSASVANDDAQKGCSFTPGTSARVKEFSVSRECGVIIK